MHRAHRRPPRSGAYQITWSNGTRRRTISAASCCAVNPATEMSAGHHPETTRDRSYVLPTPEALAKAAARVPVPKLSVAVPDNVVQLGAG